MKPIAEATLLSLLGSAPSPERIAEHLPDFLISHGFADVAALVRETVGGWNGYEEGYEEGYDRGHSVGFAKGKAVGAEQHANGAADSAGDGALQAVQQ